MLLDKYNIGFNEEVIYRNNKHLTNQLWKLIPMRENREDWKKQLMTVTVEIAGLNELFEGPLFLQLLSKLEGLLVIDVEFDLYRKTIFECINILQEIKDEAC